MYFGVAELKQELPWLTAYSTPQHFHELARDKAVVLLRQALEQVSAVLAPDYPQLHADPRTVVAAPLHLHDDDHVALHSGPRRAVVAAPLRLVLDDHPDLRFEHPRRVVPVVRQSLIIKNVVMV